MTFKFKQFYTLLKIFDTMSGMIGQMIKRVRVERNITQREMANILNLSLPGYSKIERGVNDISYNRLNQIAEALNLTVIELLSYGQPSVPDEINTGSEITGEGENMEEMENDHLQAEAIIEEFDADTQDLSTEEAQPEDVVTEDSGVEKINLSTEMPDDNPQASDLQKELYQKEVEYLKKIVELLEDKVKILESFGQNSGKVPA